MSDTEQVNTEEVGHESVDQETQETQQQSEMVPKAELQKVLDQMHKFKKQAKELEGTVKEREMSELKQREEWQKVAEIKEREAQEALEKASRLEESFLAQRKYDALKSAALSNGIRNEALSDLELIDFSDDVAIETTSTGKINVLGAENAIKKLKAERPYWFGKSMGNVNSDTPETVVGGEITMDKIMELQAEARKSGDWKAYESALKQYRGQ